MHDRNYTPYAEYANNVGSKRFRASCGASGDSAARAAKAPQGPLGNNTKSAHQDTTVCADLEQASKWQKRRDRFVMQAASQLSLGSGHRVSVCQRVPSREVQQLGGNRAVSKNEHGTAHFSGVGACGSVWACPVCAQKVAESRRSEVQAAMAAHRKTGGYAILVTFTFAHGRNDVLADMMPALAKALSRMKARVAYKKARLECGQVGSIRALEVTHGNANGWHPHVHEIWFLDRKLSRRGAVALKNSLYSIWSYCAVKFGLGEPSKRRGVDIQTGHSDDGKSAASYITKWGYELTYSQTKLAGNKGRSPWAILTDLVGTWSHRDHSLWNEYVDAFAGRSQLYWSKGLKAMFKIEEFKDSQIADRAEAEHFCTVTAEQWSAVVWLKKRAQVLEKAESMAPESVVEYLDELVKYNEAEFDRVRIAKSKTRTKITRDTLMHLKKLGLDWA